MLTWGEGDGTTNFSCPPPCLALLLLLDATLPECVTLPLVHVGLFFISTFSLRPLDQIEDSPSGSLRHHRFWPPHPAAASTTIPVRVSDQLFTGPPAATLSPHLMPLRPFDESLLPVATAKYGLQRPSRPANIRIMRNSLSDVSPRGSPWSPASDASPGGHFSTWSELALDRPPPRDPWSPDPASLSPSVRPRTSEVPLPGR
jgi:hypothetical protein